MISDPMFEHLNVALADHPGLVLQGADSGQLQRIEDFYSDPLPALWREFLVEVGGDVRGASRWGKLLSAENRAEQLSGALWNWGPGIYGAERALSDGEWAISRGLLGDWKETFSAPVFIIGAGAGSEGRVTILVGEGDDPMVLTVGDSGTAARSRPLIMLRALRYSSFLAGFFLSPELGVFQDRPPRDGPTAVFRWESTTTVPEVSEATRRFDDLLDSLTTIPLPKRDGGGPTGWLRDGFLKPRAFSGPNNLISEALSSGELRVEPTMFRSRWEALVRCCLGSVLLTEFGGEVVDGVGALGQGVGAVLGPDETRAAIRSFAVDGDFDDLCMHYRNTIAVPACTDLAETDTPEADR